MDDAAQVVEILLVEDNPVNAELSIRGLKKHNLANKLVWVKDGAEALDFIFATAAYSGRQVENNPKMIMLDLGLPKVDGMDVLRRIKKDARTQTIPVVVLTSSDDERDVTLCYQLGANSFISKPVDSEAFAKVVSELGFYWMQVNRPPRYNPKRCGW